MKDFKTETSEWADRIIAGVLPKETTDSKGREIAFPVKDILALPLRSRLLVVASIAHALDLETTDLEHQEPLEDVRAKALSRLSALDRWSRKEEPK